MSRKIGIIGCGRLGISLLCALQKTEFETVGVYDLDVQKATTYAQRHSVACCRQMEELIERADILFLTVVDQAIPIVAEGIKGCIANKVIVHCSGASGREILSRLEDLGGDVACFHPLQSFVSDAGSFQGVYIAIDANEEIFFLLAELAKSLQAQPFKVPAEQRALYHAAACIVSNYTVVLNAIAEEIFAGWKIPKAAFLPLLQGTVQNIASSPTVVDALSGPIMRGDTGTVTKHLDALPTKYLEVYKKLGLLAGSMSYARGRINDEQYKNIVSLLNGY